jgi:phosphotransferase family enzyme
MTSEPLPEGVSAEGLTHALRRCGVLGEGWVNDVAAESSRSTLLSRIVKLRLTYAGPAPDAPATMIFKTGLPERKSEERNGGRREVAFYRQVGANMRGGLLPRCFAAERDAATKDWHVLLEDLGESHRIATTWPLPPTTETCEVIIRTWARFHGAWWDDPRLGVSIGEIGDLQAAEEYLRRLAAKFAEFTDAVGDRLPSERRDFFEALLACAPRFPARVGSRRDLTIVHGDAHVWNCFLPRDGGEDVRLFDWDSWRIGVAAEDLAYMMAMHWYPDRRNRLERPLLDVYHATIQECGAKGYSRSALDDDYRLSVLWLTTVPLWQAAAKIPPLIWWNNLERIFLAVDDLECRDLLG